MDQLSIAYVNGRRVRGSEGGRVELVKLKPSIDEASLLAMLRNNGTDEVLFRSEGGDLYLLQGDPLGQGPLNLRFPRRGQQVKVGALSGEVLHADNERSYRTGCTALSVLGALIAVGTAPAAVLLGLSIGVGWAPASEMAWLLGTGATSGLVTALALRAGQRHDRLKSSARATLEPLVERRTPLAR